MYSDFFTQGFKNVEDTQNGKTVLQTCHIRELTFGQMFFVWIFFLLALFYVIPATLLGSILKPVTWAFFKLRMKWYGW